MRARVASSKTLKLDRLDADAEVEGEDSQTGAFDYQPVTPDEKFMACCLDRRLPDACLNKCNFGTYNRNSLQVILGVLFNKKDFQNMYFRIDACPMQAAADLQFCAAQGNSNSFILPLFSRPGSPRMLHAQWRRNDSCWSEMLDFLRSASRKRDTAGFKLHGML
jgi:hypothetical protein